MAAPTITIGTPSATKISAISGHDQATVTFQSDIALNNWEARATLQGITPGHGVGLLVEEGTSLAANTNATVFVDNEELTQGDQEYTITVFGHGMDGYWSDGTFEGINILDLTDENIVEYKNNSSYSNGILIFDTGTINTSESSEAIKVEAWMPDWSYQNMILMSKVLGQLTAEIHKTSDFDLICFGLNGNNRDSYIQIDVSKIMQDGETYNMTFNLIYLSMNYATVSDVSIIRQAVV